MEGSCEIHSGTVESWNPRAGKVHVCNIVQPTPCYFNLIYSKKYSWVAEMGEKQQFSSRRKVIQIRKEMCREWECKVV